MKLRITVPTTTSEKVLMIEAELSKEVLEITFKPSEDFFEARIIGAKKKKM